MNAARLILLSCWFGIAVFFSATVAPAIFNSLRAFELTNANEIAGTIVTRTLGVVNVSGALIALLLILLAFVAQQQQQRITFLIEIVSLVVMALATSIGHWMIAARMRALRAAMVLPIDQVRVDDSRRVEFSRLHVYSVTALSIAIIAALISIVLIARKPRA
ncbi:MAG: DUF4149 domain-containing protein [Pyrinomonadaceae bacterium]